MFRKWISINMFLYVMFLPRKHVLLEMFLLTFLGEKRKKKPLWDWRTVSKNLRVNSIPPLASDSKSAQIEHFRGSENPTPPIGGMLGIFDQILFFLRFEISCNFEDSKLHFGQPKSGDKSCSIWRKTGHIFFKRGFFCFKKAETKRKFFSDRSERTLFFSFSPSWAKKSCFEANMPSLPPSTVFRVPAEFENLHDHHLWKYLRFPNVRNFYRK